MKTFSESDLNIDCDFIAKGETSNDVVEKTIEHIESAHADDWQDLFGIKNKNELREKIISKIKEE